MTKKLVRAFLLLILLLVFAVPVGVGHAGTAQKQLTRVPGKSAATVFFVPLGDVRSVSLQELVKFYKQKYGLVIQTLPALQLERGALDRQRRQLIAEELIEFMKRGYPNHAANPRVILIGITEYDMYIRKYSWAFGFTYRAENRFAVVSSARMNPIILGRPADPVLLQTRLRKMITKNLGILYFHLPQSNDPSSVLYRSILGIDDLDRVGESF